MQYFLYQNGEKQGPYDFLGMVRKIKSGMLRGDCPVSVDDGNPMPAVTLEEFREFFEEIENRNETGGIGLNLSMMRSLRNSWGLIQTNPLVYLHTGVWMLVTIMLYVLLFEIGVFGIALATVLSFELFAFFIMFVLRACRGQPTDMGEIVGRAAPVLPRLLPVAIAFGVLIAASQDIFATGGLLALVLVVLLIPILFLIAGLVFAPWLMLDQGVPMGQALLRSLRVVWGSGVQNLGVVFGFVVLNFISALLVAPLIIVLPLTWGALAEIYDEMFYT